MRKRIVSMVLAVVMCVVTVVPAFASSNNLSTTPPKTPDGFVYKYSLDRNSKAEARLVDGVLVVTSLIPFLGTVSSVIGAIRFIDDWKSDSNVQATYTDYVYEALHPEAEYGVPYVYWHKLKMLYKTSNNTIEVRWGSYYEYAVAPRSMTVDQ